MGFYALAATLDDVKAAVAAGADLNLRFEVWGFAVYNQTITKPF